MVYNSFLEDQLFLLSSQLLITPLANAVPAVSLLEGPNVSEYIPRNLSLGGEAPDTGF